LQPNILFITIDNIRADKFNEHSSSYTPNLDSLSKNGVFFRQAISGSDGTTISLSNIFTGNYSIKTGIKTYYFDKNIPTFFDDLKNSGYYTSCCIPDIKFLKQIFLNFDDSIIYPYVNRDLYVGLFGGIGDEIIEKLKTNSKKPWIFYTHLMDAKPPEQIPEEFDNIKYGKMKSDRILSAIDFWIGKIINELDLTKTLVIISSDHGNFIPVDDKALNGMPKNMHKILNITKNFSFVKNNGDMLNLFLRKILRFFNKRKLQDLNDLEKRSFKTRTKTELFDELIRIPLIFSGFEIKQNDILSLVRQIDIFPTIFDIVGLPLKNNCHGRSLLSLIQGKKIEELPAFIENAVLIENFDHLKSNTNEIMKKEGNFIGIRTSEWKYQRSRYEHEQISLYNLENDPNELVNLADSLPDKIIEMEKELNLIIADSHEKDRIRSILSKKKFRL
jgi:arylsulfatase A-like enzyme